MSNSIWKTPDIKPDIFKTHRILVIYEAHDEPELMSSNEYATLTANRYVNRWCYWDEFIAQADKVDRLQKAVDYALQDLEIATKALKWLGNNRLAENPVRVEQLRRYARNTLEQIEHKEK